MTRHMTPDEFRRHGYQVIDWVADYWQTVERLPVQSPLEPGEVRRRLPELAPEDGEPFSRLLADMNDIIVPGLTHWQHPRFFGYFPSNASGPSILGELLCAGIGVQGQMWTTSPACTELEQHVLDWVVELLGLPDRFRSTGPGGGVIQDTASSSMVVALTAALQRGTGGAWRQQGSDGRNAVYASTEAHSGIDKAAVITGLGSDAVRKISVDPVTLSLDVDHLRETVRADLAAGVRPVMTLATIGTTSTTAVDPVRAIGELCAEHGIWLHVDAAYAGVAAVCPELRWLNDGVTPHVDSYATNPHKWLLTNFDCDLLWVADRRPLVAAMSIVPEFLRHPTSESGRVTDYRDWQIPLGRRFRALKLWAVLRWYGASGLRTHIRHHIRCAQDLASWIADDDTFDLVTAPTLGLVCLRLRPVGTDPDAEDQRNLALLRQLNSSGELLLSHTRAHGRITLRLAIGATLTENRHIRQAWDLLRKAAHEL